MKTFIDENFLLTTKTAESLYHDTAAAEKIIDYHCHIPPRDIARNRKFDNITQLWLENDHYKWRLMRAAGVSEDYITGGASDYEKFAKYASVLERAAGNPLYCWSNMELCRYFEADKPLGENTAKYIWEITNNTLAGLSAKQIITDSNVEIICTTDDPKDSLKYHTHISEDSDFKTRVLPAFRPDMSVNIEGAAYTDYLSELSEAANIRIDSFSALCDALCARLGYFASHGCVTADHGLVYVPYAPAPLNEIERIFKARTEGKMPSSTEVSKYKTSLLLFLGEQYARRGWVMQLHYGTVRNNNSRMYSKLGADSGYDCMLNAAPLDELTDFLNALDKKDSLPKTVIYNLNPSENAALSVIAGCFQTEGGVTKIQHGSAWWFNDHYNGIRAHLKNLAAHGYLAGFIGMLTDSRSLVSYPRHEYFRRILSDYLGQLYENGQFYGDVSILEEIVKNVCNVNAKAFFGF